MSLAFAFLAKMVPLLILSYTVVMMDLLWVLLYDQGRLFSYLQGTMELIVHPTEPVVVGTAQWALYFDGIESYASAELEQPVEVTTIEMWIHLGAVSDDPFVTNVYVIFEHFQLTYDRATRGHFTLLNLVRSDFSFSFLVTPSNRLAIEINSAFVEDDVGVLSVGEWTSIAITMFNNNVTFYVNMFKTAEFEIPEVTLAFR
jgi:hypothetical protein